MLKKLKTKTMRSMGAFIPIIVMLFALTLIICYSSLFGGLFETAQQHPIDCECTVCDFVPHVDCECEVCVSGDYNPSGKEVFTMTIFVIIAFIVIDFVINCIYFYFEYIKLYEFLNDIHIFNAIHQENLIAVPERYKELKLLYFEMQKNIRQFHVSSLLNLKRS